LKFLCKALFLLRIFEYFQLTPQSSVRAPQQAADARQPAPLAPNRRRGRRIRNGRLHAPYRDNGRGSSHAGAGRDERLSIDGRPNQGKNRQKMMEVADFREQTASMERSSPGASAQRTGIAMCAESIDPPAISNQFHAISTWRVRQTHGELPQKPDPASRTSCRLLSRTCPEDRRARKDVPKRAMRA
jgi:hypothetical protein